MQFSYTREGQNGDEIWVTADFGEVIRGHRVKTVARGKTFVKLTKRSENTYDRNSNFKLIKF